MRRVSIICTLILVLLCFPEPVLSAVCTEDAECAKDFNPKYFCDKSAGRCRRSPVVESLGPYEVLALGLCLIFSVLASSIGVSSDGMSYCFLVFCLELTTKDSIAILKVVSLFAATANLFFVLRRRREEDKDRLYVDWPLAAYCVSLVLAGCGVGALVASYFPGAYLWAAMFFTVIILTAVALQQTRRLSGEAEAPRESTLSARTWARETMADQDFFKTLTSVERKSFRELLSGSWFVIMLLVVATGLMVCGSLVKGILDHDEEAWLGFRFPAAAIGLSGCSGLALGVYLAFCAGTASLAFFAKDRLQVTYGPAQRAKFALASLTAGVLISTGTAGSLAFSALLIGLGVEPLVVWATSNIMLLLTSIETTVQFAVSGALDFQNAAFIGLFGFAGAVIGNVVIARGLKREGGSQALIAYILFVVLVLTLIVMPFTAYQEFLDDGDFFNFGKLC